MDKRWLSMMQNTTLHLIKEYRISFNLHLIMSRNGKLRCPCVKCTNVVYQSMHDLCTHCICDGFMPNKVFGMHMTILKQIMIEWMQHPNWAQRKPNHDALLFVGLLGLISQIGSEPSRRFKTEIQRSTTRCMLIIHTIGQNFN